ncbi:hypothetical protein ACIGB8_23690 [Promicromonospora sukumoe]|uniref:hypothetical protein n=1 Tax=Promicromonospora sukumoe TaxID=88382 RepID=UPI0037C7265D
MTHSLSEPTPSPFQRVDVTEWLVTGVEKRGSTPSTWLQDPNDDDVRWLHKDTTVPTSGNEQGEDWSEIFSTEVARELGVPVAPVKLCTRGGRRGSISRNIRPQDADLHEGFAVLEQCPEVIGYFPHREGGRAVDPNRPDVKRPGHSLENIQRALVGVQAPPGFNGPTALDGFDVFAGYLTLDALIANRDRHEENWAVLRPQLTNQVEQLAPSYDHASSLGFNLQDQARERFLADPSALAKWASKGTAYRFEHVSSPLTLVDLARHALSMSSEAGRHHWTTRVAELTLKTVHDALEGGTVPEMSVAACRFARTVLDHNLGRLRDAIAGT